MNVFLHDCCSSLKCMRMRRVKKLVISFNNPVATKTPTRCNDAITTANMMISLNRPLDQHHLFFHLLLQLRSAAKNGREIPVCIHGVPYINYNITKLPSECEEHIWYHHANYKRVKTRKCISA